MVICLGLGMGLVVLAQETSVEEDVELDENIEAEDLEIEEPTLLPDSPFYFLKNWGRAIQSFFTFNSIKKAGLRSRFANERLIEIKILTRRMKKAEIIEKAIENYQNEIEKIKESADKIRESAEENEEVGKFLDKFTNHQLLHQRILQKLEEQVPEEVFEKIKEARERHLERFGEVMTKLENREEKIRERLEEQMEKQEGSKYKNFKNLEVLIELKEKVPEQAKEAIRKAQENTLKRLKGDLEKMSPEDQERFKEYVDKISGDEDKHFYILENLKFELKEKTQLREKINEASEGILEKVKEQARNMNCRIIEKPTPDFCSNGTIVIQRDENGCVTGLKCRIPARIGR